MASEFILASLKKRSISDIKQRIGKLYDFFAGKDLKALRGQDVRAFISWRREQGVSDSTVNRELATLQAAINHAIVHLEWQLPNPVKGRMLEEPEGRVRWITKGEAARLIQCASQLRSGDRLADFIQLALHTGCRMNEMLELEWNRVDLQRKLMWLDGINTKSKRRRGVPLNDVAMAAVMSRASFRAEHCPHSPWVFCNKQGKRLVAIREGFKSACKAAGISDFRIHDLRHTAASWMVSEGVPLADVKEVLGHSTITMTEKYAHLAPHRAREAVEKLQSHSKHTESPARRIESLIGRKRREKAL